MRATEFDYCFSGPRVDISWTYSDATAQSAYQVQIDNDPAFGSPNFNSGKVAGAAVSMSAMGTGAAGVGPALTWNTTYYSRVRVYDSLDLVSAWANQTLCTGPGCIGGTSWRTPTNAYPVASFTNIPTKPGAGQAAQFTDTSVCAGGGCVGWLWDFDDGTTDTVQNPSHTWAVNGSYSVMLSVTDADAHLCSITTALTVNKAVPFWREVLPW